MDPYRRQLNLYVKNKMNSILCKDVFNIEPAVSVIACSNRPENISEVFDSFLRQTIKKKELIIILNNNDMNIDDLLERAKVFDNIKVFQLDESLSLGDCFELGLNNSQFDFIAKFDDDDYYGKDYLSQAIKAFNQVDCDVVGKSSYYIYFTARKTLAIYGANKGNRFVNRVTDSSLVFKKQVFENIEIPKIKKAGTFTIIQNQIRENGMKFYSTDQLNYMVIRNSKDQHTWKITEDEYLSYKPVKIVAQNIEDPIPYIQIDK